MLTTTSAAFKREVQTALRGVAQLGTATSMLRARLTNKSTRHAGVPHQAPIEAMKTMSVALAL